MDYYPYIISYALLFFLFRLAILNFSWEEIPPKVQDALVSCIKRLERILTYRALAI
jgi:hypothetical protein